MHQIDGAGATQDSLFTEGDANQAIPATQVTADWLNSVQEELVAIVEHGGGELDKEDNGQVLAKILEMIATGEGLSKDHTPDNGYATLPGGLILQWCKILTSTTEQTFNYPVAFPTAALGVWISSSGQVAGSGETQQAELNGLVNFKAGNDTATSRNARVFAIGI